MTGNIATGEKSGDVIALQGADFGTAPVLTVSDGTTTGTMTLANGGILNKDDQGTLVSAQLPAGLIPGKICRVTITNGSNSTFKDINVPEIRGYLDLAGLEVTPNRTFRIYGDNLYAPGLETKVFLNQGTASYPCTLIVADPNQDRFVIKVTTPANLPTSGTFTVFVRTGGVTTGFGVAGAQTLTGRVNGNDVWDLGVPWGADYAPFFSFTYNVKNSPYGATGNGATDDSLAIQRAIDDASNAGGTVYLPTGTYNVGASVISVKSKVVLKGDGMDKTTIKADSTSAKERVVSMDGNLVGLVDLRIFVAPGVGTAAIPGRECTYSNARAKLFALRCQFEQQKPAATNYTQAFAIRWDNANQTVIKKCVTNITARRHDFGNVVLQGGKRCALYREYPNISFIAHLAR